MPSPEPMVKDPEATAGSLKHSESNLFSTINIRNLTFRNRIVVSPMCQYSSQDGFANEWHTVHLASRAVGGAALVFTEAAAVEQRGRISPADLGIWKDEQISNLAGITRLLRGQSAIAGIQLAHAGRKGSTRVPWQGGESIPASHGGWQTVGPSPNPFRPDDPAPAEMNVVEIRGTIDAFAAAAKRALAAGFQVIEIHGAHGYLIHQFLSPLSNSRTDEYGGSFENRIRFCLQTIEAVRSVWPEDLPLFLRISAQDWVEGGWQLEDSIELSRRAGALGVDLIDCSSGGAVPYAKIQAGPAYQTPFAERIRAATGLLTGAVGMITEPSQANEIIRDRKADMILLARAFLRDPYWPLHAAQILGVKVTVPVQYERAFPR